MTEKFQEWQASKKERLKAIESLIQKHEIKNQPQLVKLLKSEFKIKTNQSAVSRDVKSLGLIKDEKTGCYVYSQETIQKQNFRKLANWAKQAEVKSFKTTFQGGLLFRTSPQQAESAHLIASIIEKVFSTDKHPVASFVNSSGFIWVVVSSEKKKMVEENLKKIFKSD